MKFATFKATLLTLLFIIPICVFAQKELIAVSGKSSVAHIDPTTLNQTTLKALGHDGKEHTYSGVLLAEVLTKAGIVLGNKKESISSYILIKAKDNYKALFSLAEIDPIFSRQTILVAHQINGKALENTNAPFQIIVPGDKVQTRWIRQVVSIELVEVK